MGIIGDPVGFRQKSTNLHHSEPTIWTAACDSSLTLGRSASGGDERADDPEAWTGKPTQCDSSERPPYNAVGAAEDLTFRFDPTKALLV